VVNYSRVNVVKHALSGATVQSRVTRASAEQQLLREHGDQTMVLQLQGFIFFGTAGALVDRVRQRLHAHGLPLLRAVLIDFRQVAGADSTATVSFLRLQQLAHTARFELVIAGLAPALRSQLARAGFPEPGADRVRFEPDLDRGLEWCEGLIGRAELPPAGPIPPLAEQLRAIAPEARGLDGLIRHMERREVPAGTVLMRRGDAADEVYFLEDGQVTAQLVPAEGAPVRLESMRHGRIVGELGLYRGSVRTADVVADQHSVVYRLTLDELRRLEQEEPEAAAAFHQLVARLMAERVAHLITTVDALQR
jgi:sulfate permease, SulP family